MNLIEPTLKILIWPNPKLKVVSNTVTRPVNPFFIEQMFEVMNKHNGVGLSAIQVGIPERIFITCVGGVRQVFVNPEWHTPIPDFLPPCAPVPQTPNIKPVPMNEGCLSTPGEFEIVYRWPEILVSFEDADLKYWSLTVKGLMAQVVQHETEHCEGKMFTDHLKPAARSRIMGAMMKLKRSGGSR